MTRLAGVESQLLSLKIIAEREGLSAGYLEEIARRLKRAKLIESVRGAHGGYRLAKSAASITVAEVLIALEGPVRTMVCVGDEATRYHCPLESQCISRQVWQRVNDTLRATFASMTLSDLCRSVVTAVAA